MSKSELPDRVDAYKLADQAASFDGVVASERLSRLREAVLGMDDAFTASLSFFLDEEHRRIVAGQVAGGVELECQRCLRPMQHRIESRFRLPIVYNDEMARALPAGEEPLLLLPDEPLDVAAIVEEELLLSLPLQAMHDADDCRIQTEFGPDPEDPAVAGDDTDRNNPFDVLAALKKD